MGDFLLPDIGEGLAEAELLGWLVAPGDPVTEGQPVCEVSTDKVTVELPAPRDGVITELLWSVGDVVPVGSALLRMDGEERTAAAESPAAAAPAPARTELPATPAVPPAPGRRVVAAPSTRRYAHGLGVDLRTVAGTGPAGRILRADVDAARAAEHPTPPQAAAPADAGVTREPLTGLRATAARRMAQSSQTYATATSSIVVHADGLVRMVETLRPRAEQEGVRWGTLPLVLAVVASTLARHPRFNATVDEADQSLLLHRDVDLGVAVAGRDGLIVPVIPAADSLRVLGLARHLEGLVARAREGRLGSDDLRPGTFTVSSTGGHEQADFISTTPVINPPHTATLWVSRVRVRPRVRDGVLEAGPTLSCSLSIDHRFIDGLELTTFLNDLSAALLAPETALA